MSCQALDAEELLRHFLQLANNRQWAAMGQLLDPAMRYELPQTREFIAGREGFVDFFATWPQPWRLELERCIAQGDQLAVHLSFHDESDRPMTCLGFYELVAGRIRRIVEYWPVAYEPPARHCAHVQRLP